MYKPWYKSLSITGALTTALGIVSDPNVLAILPSNITRVVAAIGGVATIIGLRKAIPEPAEVAAAATTTFPAAYPPGFVPIAVVNEHGETPQQYYERRGAMDAAAAVNMDRLTGGWRPPAPPAPGTTGGPPSGG